MNDIEKDLEVKELTDKVHTYNLKANIILFSKYVLLSFLVLFLIILINSIF